MAAQPEGPDGFFSVFDTYVGLTPTPALSFGLDVNYVTNEVNKIRRRRCRCRASGVYARYQAHEPRCAVACATSGSTTKGCLAASIRCCTRSR